MISDPLESFRNLRKKQEEIDRTYLLPKLAALEIVKATLPLASTRLVAVHVSDDETPYYHKETEDSAAVWNQRAEAYLVLRHGSILRNQLNSRDGTASIDLTAPDKDGELASGYTEDQMKLAVAEFWNSMKSEREEFRNALESIIRDKEKAQMKLKSYLSSAAQEILFVPTPNWPESDVVEVSYVPLSDKGVLGCVLMVLLKTPKISSHLRKCRADSCQDIFLTDGPSSGGPRFRYCSDVCRKAQRKIQLIEAQEEFHKAKKGGKKNVSKRTSTSRKRGRRNK